MDSKALDVLDKQLAKLKTGVKVVGTAAVGAAASLFGLATFTGEAGAEIQRAADRIGIGAEELQAYQYAARVAGQSNEGFQASLQTLVKNLFDARRGLGSSREAFYLLSNVLGKDLLQRGMSAEEVLNDVADGLTRISDPSRKLELAQQLFGGDGGAMLTTLARGSQGLREMGDEARRLGAVMGTDAIKASTRFHADLERTKAVVLGLRNSLGVALFPVIQGVMAEFREWILVNRQWLQTGLTSTLKVLSVVLGRLFSDLTHVVKGVNAGLKVFGGFNKVLTFLAKIVIPAVVAGMAAFALETTLAALPFLALGAAIAGVLLVLDDLIAYFQGRKSITGLIVKDFGSLEEKISGFFEPILEKVRAWGKSVGKAIVDGISNLKAEDFQKLASIIKNVLTLAFDLGALPLQFGAAIAEGIIQGLVAGLAKRFPKLADMLGITAEGGGNSQGGSGVPSAGDVAKSAFPVQALALQGMQSVLGSLTSGKLNPAMLALTAAMPAAGAAVSTVINAPITVNAAPGTDPRHIATTIQKHLDDQQDKAKRQTSAATQSAISH